MNARADGRLPAEPHLPGLTARPAGGYFMEVADRAPQRTDPDAWRSNEAWLYGFTLYRNGFFWEAHEVWEPVWMGTAPNSQVRRLTQGLIQLANACLKLAMAREKAALRLLDHALECLADARHAGPALCMGVDTGRITEAAARFRGHVADGAQPGPALAELRPAIELENAL